MEFIWTDGKTDFEGCCFVRKKVFVEEQGFAEENEFDEIDNSARHLLICEYGQPLATARLYRESGCWHVGRICVLAECRGRGLGAALLDAAERKARSLGASRLILGAQKRAAGFYEKCGYHVCGGEYMDEFCPHVLMGKDLEREPEGLQRASSVVK